MPTFLMRVIAFFCFLDFMYPGWAGAPVPKTTFQKPFWTTGRVLLLSAFTGSLTYLYGINDTSSSFRQGDAKTEAKKPVYASRKDMEKAIAELRELLGDEDAISTDDEDLHRHGYSEWSSINIDQLPIAVAYPKSTEEVSRVAKFRTPGLFPRSQLLRAIGGMSIDFTFMDKIIALHADDLDVVVQPSVGWMSLNEQIKDSGLFSPSTQAHPL
ncbi:D-lactate ferricytochrome c oxidoreductase [Taxawa tesnikishii (nom. ined.)]|nr:D-lactate ferricytochrome c oxidoreductase [Dothideales sp. JES 119]